MVKPSGSLSLWRGGPIETQQPEHDAASPFSTDSLFFSFPLRKNSCKTPYYSLLFQFISHLSPCPNSPTLLVSHSFHLTLNCLLVFSPFLSQHLSTVTPILKGFPSKRSVETAMSCNLSHFFRYHLGNKNHLTASLRNTCTVSLVPLCTRVENRSGIATDIS